MPTFVSRLLAWVGLALMVLVGPVAMRPLAAQAEELETLEAPCAAEVAGASVRIFRFFYPSRPAHGVWSPATSDGRLSAFHNAHLSTSSRGHKLPNGLNAPLLT